MGFDFPNAPAVGAIYQPVPGLSYHWDGTAWREVTASTATAQTRNRLINGAMQISQENGDTSSGVNNYRMADSWMLIRGGTGTFIGQRVQVTTPYGSVNRCRISVTVADAAIAGGDCLYFAQPLEGINTADFQWGTAQAKQVVLRFGFKGPAGTYCVNIENAAYAASYVANFTVTAGEANTDVIRTCVIPPCTFGVWPTGAVRSMWLDIMLMCGPTYQAPAVGWSAGDYLASTTISNGAGTVGNTFELYDVGLYLDPNNTGVAPPWEMPSYADDERACLRYYWKAGTNWGYRGALAGSTALTRVYQWTFSVPMRVAPTGAFTGGAASITVLATAVDQILVQSTEANSTNVVSITAGTLNARL
jgi:hypothetical protein